MLCYVTVEVCLRVEAIAARFAKSLLLHVFVVVTAVHVSTQRDLCWILLSTKLTTVTLHNHPCVDVMLRAHECAVLIYSYHLDS